MEIKFKIIFEEGLLGTSPADAEIYSNYIGSKAPDASTVEDEVAALGVDEVVEKGMTIFPRNAAGTPFLYDYQIRGFFKDACGALSRVKSESNESGKLKAYKKIIDGLIFVYPREIEIHVNGEIKTCQRPLRAQTAQGERIALAISEEVPAGSWCEFTVKFLEESHAAAIREWMEYGELRGLGQWRNSGKGRFTFEEVE